MSGPQSPTETAAEPDDRFAALYPSEEGIRAQVTRRQRVATTWRFAFLAATSLAVVILSTLLLSIINQSFGLVAEQTDIPEEQLVADYYKSRLTGAANVLLSTEDDGAIAAGIAGDANGVGLLGYAVYAANQPALRAVNIDGRAPTAETVAAGEYPLTRPLRLYSSASTLAGKPQVAAFVLYYLQHAEEVMDEMGAFPADAATLTEEAAALATTLGLDATATIDPAAYEGDIVISGSSTLNPITRAIARRFRNEGFLGAIKIGRVGTVAGFQAFCSGNADLVAASRPVAAVESAACRGNGLTPLGLQVGVDPVVVAVNSDNTFADDVSGEQLAHLFTTATDWTAVAAGWPADPIHRFLPTADSGTMDVFVATVFPGQMLDDLPYDALVQIFQANVTAGRCRAVEAEQRFYADRFVCDTEAAFTARCQTDAAPTGCVLEPRNQGSLVTLIQADVVNPVVQQAWFLAESLFHREEVMAEARAAYPDADIHFRRWLTLDFLTRPQSSQPELAGVRTAILGSLWVVLIGVLVGFPVGVGAAIYLEEYADKRRRFNRFIQTNINNLAGVPSIIYGLLGLTVFVRLLEPITSGAVFGVGDGTTANGRTVLSAGLTLALLILPVIIISAQEAIKAVPRSLREASLGLGATKWQTIWNHVIPNAIGGIMTGVILAMSRIIGETAPLIVVGASTFITADPTGPFSKFTTLPTQIFQWTSRPQQTFLLIAGAAIIVLIVLLFILNAFAIYLRNRYARRIG